MSPGPLRKFAEIFEDKYLGIDMNILLLLCVMLCSYCRNEACPRSVEQYAPCLATSGHQAGHHHLQVLQLAFPQQIFKKLWTQPRKRWLVAVPRSVYFLLNSENGWEVETLQIDDTRSKQFGFRGAHSEKNQWLKISLPCPFNGSFSKKFYNILFILGCEHPMVTTIIHYSSSSQVCKW